jgi:hypothetical protein
MKRLGCLGDVLLISRKKVPLRPKFRSPVLGDYQRRRTRLFPKDSIMTKQFSPNTFATVDYVNRLSLDQVRPLQRWTLAPLGSLLQLEITKGAQPAVFLRAEYDDASGGGDALLCLSGEDTGVLIPDKLAMRSFALDVTGLVRLVAVDPAPFDLTATGGAPVGSLVYNWAGGDSYFVRTKLFEPSGAGQSGFVCVSSTNPKHQVGKTYVSLAGSDRMGIAAKVAVEPVST